MHVRGTIFLTLAVLAALPLRPAAARAPEHQSARIASLGGDHVAGVIPDLYTDIGVNPAYAFFADRLNASYARRYDPGYDPSLPYLMEGSNTIYGSSMMVNELSAWGIRLSSWRTAVFAQWALDRPESVSSYPRTEFDTDSYVELREETYSYSNDYARIDLAAARALGGRTTLGLRIQGRAYNYSDSRMTTRAINRYDDLYFSALEDERRQTVLQSYSERRYAIDLQAGIARSDDAGPRTDLAITVSLDRPDYRHEEYELNIEKEYLPPEEEISSYYYYRYHWNDAREGDKWRLALTFRHSFDGGIRLLAGGYLSTCSYHTDWSGSEESLRWGGWSPVDTKVAGSFGDDGSLLDGSCWLKGNKVFRIHRTTDLHLGLHGVYARIRAEEEPLVHYSIREGEGASAVQVDQSVRLESIETAFALYLPLSVEFRPSSWFSYFSGFTLSGRWRKASITQPVPSLFTYQPPAGVSRAGSANLAGTSAAAVVEPAAYSNDWERELSTGAAVTLGFSFHYGDKFFVDVYTESDIVPTNLSNNVIDVRYAF
jgi:hypothetical protein